MSAETLFAIANSLALTGWIALALAPLAPRAVDLYAGWVLPGLLGIGYSVLVVVYAFDAPGGYGSLAEVQALFDTPHVALAGWVHFLAFDLFVGAWIIRRARAEGIAHLAVLPILPLAFLFAPAGLLAWFGLAQVFGRPALGAREA